ncbi:MAG: class B sortase [Clostridia bacterium]|nr:class B sortase [Clostridia bacterium]
MKSRHGKRSNNLKKIILIILIIIIILSISYMVYYFYNNYKNKIDNTDILNNIEIDKTQMTEQKTERMLQIEELQKKNQEIMGWLEIEGTNINYPVLQTNDNDFYLTHNYKKENASTGSLFLDKDFDLINGSSNYLIYGHRNKQGLMFEDLMKYAKEDFYKEHTKIKFTTNKEESTYEIMSVFYSRVYYKSEQNVFRYYYFVNANNEQEYNDFVNNAKKASIYDTGVNANYGEQLLTLSTCEYSQEDGRFVVVAKKIN